MENASKNIVIGLIVAMFVGFAGYGWINSLDGWGWWMFGAFAAAVVLT